MSAATLERPTLSSMAVDRLRGWRERVPDSFDGVVSLPGDRVARVEYGHQRWIVAAPHAGALLRAEQPSRLQEPSPERDLPPAAAPPSSSPSPDLAQEDPPSWQQSPTPR